MAGGGKRACGWMLMIKRSEVEWLSRRIIAQVQRCRGSGFLVLTGRLNEAEVSKSCLLRACCGTQTI
jgi:hypothetical protein